MDGLAEIAAESGMLEALGMVLGIWAMGLLISLTMYVLNALGLYTIANRRKIRRPWLAWIPVADMYLMGCISDQYRQVSCLQTTRRRVILLALAIANAVAGLLTTVMAVVALAQMVEIIPQLDALDVDAAVNQIMMPFMRMSSVSSGMSLLSLAYTVMRYVVLYDVFASCVPENKTMFLVLSIIFNFLEPILLFANRNRDGGMRTVEPAPSTWVQPEVNLIPEAAPVEAEEAPVEAEAAPVEAEAPAQTEE